MQSLASSNLTSATQALHAHLKSGHVYRREDLCGVSNAVDRHLKELVGAGTLTKVAPGLYYAPKSSRFGALPPDEHRLIHAFLRDDLFLLLSPSQYNAVGVGTTQLYNTTVVYNHKRHGRFTLGRREFDFRIKPRFPRVLSREFLFVDLLNNLGTLAEDLESVLARAEQQVKTFDSTKLARAAHAYGSVSTRRRLSAWLQAKVRA